MQILKSFYKLLSPKYQALFLEYKTDFKPRYVHGKSAHPSVEHSAGQGSHEQLNFIINQNREVYSHHLTEFLKYKKVFEKIPFEKSSDESEPYWNNEYLPGLDIISLYCLINTFRPKKYVEVGSGNSTMVARKSIRENTLQTKLISIDPFPRASIDNLETSNWMYCINIHLFSEET